jgi:hypothetical protein
MENIDINIFVNENQIEEKIPYFGKARLYTIQIFKDKETRFEIPREIFHFITAIYILNPKSACDIKFKVNSYEKIIKDNMYSDINNEINNRNNLINDPIFLGNHMKIYFEMKAQDTSDNIILLNILIEYAKILPQLFIDLHTNNIILSSKQDIQTILIYKGNSP